MQDVFATGTQIGSIILASVTEAFDWLAWPIIPATLFLVAAVAWVFRLVSSPDVRAALFRASFYGLDSLSIRYAFGAYSLRSLTHPAQFQSAASRRETDLADAYGRANWPYGADWDDLTPTIAMTSMRDAPLANRVEAYRVRINHVRAEHIRAMKQLDLLSSRWTIIGVGAAIVGVGLAIAQASGGPAGFFGLLTTISAGAVAWLESRASNEKRARLRRAIRLLDNGLIRLSEVHSDNSWATMVDELEDALEAPYTESTYIYKLTTLDK